MGKVQQGILDGFIGKVGTVVGSFWKGKPVMRGYKRQIHDAQTEAQQLVRTRFAAINSLSSAFLSAIRLGFAETARSRRTTEGNVFVKLNWDYVHAEAPGSATVDYDELQVAKGNLPEILFGSATFTNPYQVAVAIDDPASAVRASPDDLVYVYVYSPEAAAGVLSAPKLSSDTEITCDVPDYWVGQRVHVYGFGIGDGLDNEGRIANSRYLGSGTIS